MTSVYKQCYTYYSLSFSSHFYQQENNQKITEDDKEDFSSNNKIMNGISNDAFYKDPEKSERVIKFGSMQNGEWHRHRESQISHIWG